MMVSASSVPPSNTAHAQWGEPVYVRHREPPRQRVPRLPTEPRSGGPPPVRARVMRCAADTPAHIPASHDARDSMNSPLRGMDRPLRRRAHPPRPPGAQRPARTIGTYSAPTLRTRPSSSTSTCTMGIRSDLGKELRTLLGSDIIKGRSPSSGLLRLAPLPPVRVPSPSPRST